MNIEVHSIATGQEKRHPCRTGQMPPGEKGGVERGINLFRALTKGKGAKKRCVSNKKIS